MRSRARDGNFGAAKTGVGAGGADGSAIDSARAEGRAVETRSSPNVLARSVSDGIGRGATGREYCCRR